MSRAVNRELALAGVSRYGSNLCGSSELLEPDRQPVAIGTILKPSRHVDQYSGDPLKAEFEKRAVMNFEQRVRDVNSEIGVDPDQVGIEGGMMELRYR
jgi:hypothetical protein